MFDAVILAGGDNPQFADSVHPGPVLEALVDIDGKPMVVYVTEALAACPEVGRIFVVGPKARLMACPFGPTVTVVEGGDTIFSTAAKGLALIEDDRQTLLATSDIPLLTPEAVSDFVRQAAPLNAEFCYPIVTKETCERQFPGVRRTYVRLKEGVFTGGNLFLVRPSVVQRCQKAAEEIIARRKAPLALCRLLGWRFVLGLLLGRLELPDLEKCVSDLLQLEGRVLVSQYAEIGLDVDKPSDLTLVRQAARRLRTAESPSAG